MPDWPIYIFPDAVNPGDDCPHCGGVTVGLWNDDTLLTVCTDCQRRFLA